MRKYSHKEILLLEQAAVQLGECDRLLDNAGVPNVVERDGKKFNSTDERLKHHLNKLPECKPFFPRFRLTCHWNSNQLGTFFGSMTSLSGDAINVWIYKWNIYLYKK